MKHPYLSLATFRTLGSVLALAFGLGACAALPAMGAGGADSWKEEVLLHDGQKIIVERNQTYGPRPVIDKWPKIKEQTLSFTLPGSTRELTWKSEYAEDIGGNMNFVPLALHVLESRPYVIATPVGCLGYNKWGRPNPPYVVFKHDGKTWQRIPLTELPTQFKDINLVVGTSARAAEALTALPLVDVEAVRRFNRDVRPVEFKTILREPLAKGTVGSSVNCDEVVYYKGAWVGPGDSIGKRMMDSRSK
ncbi:MAG: hypothetical protein ACYCZ6_02320 [Polaromonas sp.]